MLLKSNIAENGGKFFLIFWDIYDNELKTLLISKPNKHFLKKKKISSTGRQILTFSLQKLNVLFRNNFRS